MCVQSRVSVSVIHDDIVTETPVICSYDYSAGLSCQNSRSAWSCQVYATVQFLFTGDRMSSVSISGRHFIIGRRCRIMEIPL